MRVHVRSQPGRAAGGGGAMLGRLRAVGKTKVLQSKTINNGDVSIVGNNGCVEERWQWTPPPPQHLLFLPPSSSLHPLPPSLPCPSPSVPHPQLAAEDGCSESSWDGDQRQIAATAMLAVVRNPPPHPTPATLPLLILLPQPPSPRSQAVLFSSLLCLVAV